MLGRAIRGGAGLLGQGMQIALPWLVLGRCAC